MQIGRLEMSIDPRMSAFYNNSMDSPSASVKRILILTSDAGFGHRSAANAVAAALDERYGAVCAANIENPMNDRRVPLLLRSSQDDYDKLVRTAPKLYNLGYDLSDAVAPAILMDSALTVMLFEALFRLVQRIRPDAIVTTYPLYQAPLKAVSQVRRWHIPLITVVTDLVTVHTIWFHDASDYCLVPTEKVRELAIRNGVASEKVEITGIPVHPEVLHSAGEPSVLREQLGWRNDLPTLLVVGSKRVGRLRDVLHLLNHAALPLQLVVVAGGDDALYAELQTTTWHLPTHTYNFVKNLPTMMHAADCILCKAGGLIVSESLAVGLPMILVDVLPGQEVGNAEFVIEHRAGAWARNPVAVLELLHHWLDRDGQGLAERATNARRLGHPRAAYAVAERAWAVAEVGPRHRKERPRSVERSRLVAWLRRNNVALPDEL